MLDFIAQFTDKEVIDPKDVVQIGNRFYLGKTPKHDPTYFDTFLGETKGKKFKPSFILLDMIGKHATKAIVDDKQAWLFVCGRDLFEPYRFMKDGVEVQEPRQKVILIATEDDEILGFGIFKKDLIKNVLDRGDFLRRER